MPVPATPPIWPSAPSAPRSRLTRGAGARATSPAASWRGCVAVRRPDRPSPRPGLRPPARSLPAAPQPAVRSGPLGLELGSQRLGSQGIELHGVGFTWPDGRRVLEPIDLGLEPGDRLGVVGGNGVGKTHSARPHRRAAAADGGSHHAWSHRPHRLLRPTRSRSAPRCSACAMSSPATRASRR